MSTAVALTLTTKDASGNAIGTYYVAKNNLKATTNPSVTDDNTAGYIASSVWINRSANRGFMLLDNSTGAAVWVEIPTTIPASLDYYSAENKEGSTIDAGMACSVHSSGTGVVKASAADNTKIAIGLLQTTVLSTHAGNVQIEGLFTLANWTAIIGSTTLAAKTTYFLDPTTPGKLTSTPPSTQGQTVQLIGTAVTPYVLELTIDTPILL